MGSEKIEAMAWAVNCPARHECDFLVFHDPQDAECQAEQWNEDHPEGENPHKIVPLYPDLDAEIERLKAQLAASEEKRKVLAKFYKTGERYVESRYNQDDIHNAGYFSAQAAYAQAKLDIEAAKAMEAP